MKLLKIKCPSCYRTLKIKRPVSGSIHSCKCGKFVPLIEAVGRRKNRPGRKPGVITSKRRKKEAKWLNGERSKTNCGNRS